MNKVNFPQAIDDYFLFARARHLSEYTIRDYRNTFKEFRSFIGDEIFLDEILIVVKHSEYDYRSGTGHGTAG